MGRFIRHKEASRRACASALLAICRNIVEEGLGLVGAPARTSRPEDPMGEQLRAIISRTQQRLQAISYRFLPPISKMERKVATVKKSNATALDTILARQ